MSWKNILKEERNEYSQKDILFQINEIPYGQTTEHGPLVSATIDRDELRFGVEQSVIGKVIKLLKENKNAYERFDKKMRDNSYSILVRYSKDLEESDEQYVKLDRLLKQIVAILKSSKYTKKVM
jgi:hypothetical protein|tara:strand:+ start:245 stop:616 length:372 start_codon:yes stop_codon:yes gene_type:complete